MNNQKLLRLILQFIAISAILFLSSCNKKSTTEPDDNEVVISDNVILPDEDPEITIDEIGEDQITMTFTGDVPDIAENDILVGGDEENGGYLRKVSSVTVDGNTMEIQTAQAVLTEVIENGSLDTTLSLDFGGTNRSLYGLELVRKMDGVTVRENGIEISGTELFNDNFNGTDVLISIPTGTVTFTPDLNLAFDINWGHLHEFHAIASGQLNFNFDIRGEFSGSIADFNNDDHPIELASFSHSFFQAVGVVPVWETVTLTFEAGYSVDMGYSGAVQAGFDSNIGIECGARWLEGSWSDVWNPSYDFNLHPPEWNAEAHVQIRGYVRPTISIELYSMAGPYLDVEPYARFNAVVEENPPTWQWGLWGGMESTLGFQIHVLDWELAEWNTELLDPPYEDTLAFDSGEIIPNTPPVIESLTANPMDILVNQTSQVVCTATDEDGNTLTYNWSVTCGSTSGSGNMVTFTAPATPNTCTVSCNVNDGHGGTDNESVSIIVNGPPGYVTLLSPTNGQENLPIELQFSWYEVSGAEYYDLQISTNPYFSTYLYFIENITETETTISDLSYGTLYYWRVRASNAYGDGPWSALLTSFTTGTPPAVPDLISPSDGAIDQPLNLQLSWASVTGATGYLIEVSESDSFSDNYFAGPTEATAIEITGLSNNTVYYWHVSAYDDFGSSEYSAAWHFTTEPGGGSSGDFEMVSLPGGSFQMGDIWSAGYGDELPVHTVTLSSFQISSTEITNQQYADYLTEALASSDITATSSSVTGPWDGGGNYMYLDLNNSYCQISYSGGAFTVDNGEENHPVIVVSWYGAVAFAEHYGYRLPTEAEWEYAARGLSAGADTKWSGTSTESDLPDYAWYSANNNPSGTKEVGTKIPNANGLYDMSGNVWEWCSDWYSSSYYNSSPEVNPQGPESGSHRVLRGGSYYGDADDLRCSFRNYTYPNRTNINLGFRLSGTN